MQRHSSLALQRMVMSSKSHVEWQQMQAEIMHGMVVGGLVGCCVVKNGRAQRSAKFDEMISPRLAKTDGLITTSVYSTGTVKVSCRLTF